MAELIQVRHKDDADDVTPGTVSREAFEQVFAPKGFVEVTSGKALGDMKKSELVAEAGRRGVEVPSGATVADLLALLEG